MQAAEVGNRDDLTPGRRFDLSRHWRISVQRLVRTGFMVIVEILLHDAAKMAFSQDDHVVKAFAAQAPDPAFRETALPRRSQCSAVQCSAVVTCWSPQLFTRCTNSAP